MAGMFYSLKETAQRLGISEDQVKQLAKDNKIREFRDGSNLLFKIEEINALLAEGLDFSAKELELPEAPAEELPAEALEEEAAPALSESLEDDIFKLDEAIPGLEAAGEGEGTSDLDLDLIPELEAQEEPPVAEAPSTPEAAEELVVSETEEVSETTEEQQEVTAQAGEEDFLLAEDQELPAEAAEGSSEEISLAPESGVLAAGSDITDMDTALTGEGVNVLGETDTDYNVTEDSMAETAGPAASAGTSAEASLEEIEDDVNLDSFGSGSGLLDLSLQADDTSLGGILDEIYTAEGGEGEAATAEAEEGSGEAPAFEEITAEAEHAAPEEEIAVPEPVAVMPTSMAPAYAAEVAPDAQSNILGTLLFLPLAVLLYTAIVTIAATRPEPVVPSILSSVQGRIWYIMGGLIVVALIAVGASFMAGVERAPKAAKPAKDKKVKAEKPKKEKAAQAEKSAKEKKGFFGKKK